MEKLQRRSDGFFETPSGLVAISPRAVSGRKDGLAFFEFKSSLLSEIVRIEWPDGAPVIALEADHARVMIKNNYALNIDNDQMTAYNNAVDAYLASASAPAVTTQAEPPAAPVEDAPAVPDVPVPDVVDPPPVPEAPAAADAVPAAPSEEGGAKKKGK